MQWLTVKEVETAAKKSKRAASACVKKHWKQLAIATEAQFRAKENSLKHTCLISADYCALCHYCGQLPYFSKSNCLKCPLRKKEYKATCCKEYQAAFFARTGFLHRKKPYSIFTKAAKAMYDRICKL